MNVHRERGMRLWQVKRYDLAAREFRAALALEPNDSTAHALLAACLLELKQRFEAEREALTAVGCNAEDAYAFYTLSRVRASMGNYREAFQAIAEAIQLVPHDADYHYLRAALFYDTNRHRESLQTTEAALRADPRHVHAANLRLMNFRALGKFDQVDAEIDRVLALNPEFAWSHENKGWAALRTGARGDALYHFREALRLNPNRASPKRGLVLAIQARNPLCRLLNWLLLPDASRRVVFMRWGLLIVASAATTWLIGADDPVPTAFVLFFALLMVWFLAMVLFAWVGEPFFLFMLRFDPLGKGLLTRDERHAANAAACVLLGGATALTAAIVFQQPVLYGIAAASFALPFPMYFILRQRTFRNRMFTLLDVAAASLFWMFMLLTLFVVPLLGGFLAMFCFSWSIRLVRERAAARMEDDEDV